MSTLPTLLVVDDKVRGLQTLQRILEEDFDVKTAATIDAAERILHQEWVQIILCDQRMPEITGVEFLKQVREGEKDPVAVQHIVRSFDPCMVCTVH